MYPLLAVRGRRSAPLRPAGTTGSGRSWGRVLLSSSLLGAVAAIASWSVSFVMPAPGLDPSWWAALYMGAADGLHFGTDMVFTYGPLGFLRMPWSFDSGLATLAFAYQAVLHLALAVSFVWALRRTVAPLVALVLATAILLVAPALEVSLTLATVWCLVALAPDPPPRATTLVVVGGGLLGGVETLVQLRSGPVVLAICTITLLASDRSGRDLLAFAGIAVTTFLACWWAAGQGLGNLPEFVANGMQIVSGYGEAMGTPASSPLTPAATVALGALLVLAAGAQAHSRRRRVAAVAVAGVVVFTLYKEANVRADINHAEIFFATAAGIGAALTFGGRRSVVLGAVLGLVCVNLAVDHRTGLPVRAFDPVAHARSAVTGVRTAFDRSRRDRDLFVAAIRLATTYRLPPETTALLRGRTVHVSPWEAAVAWEGGLRWDPLPVFQDYSAYTSGLDGLNARRLTSPDGPERILRENVRAVDPTYRAQAIDQRFPGWDPPSQMRAMLCHYAPLQTTTRWQVLGRVSSRCGAPRRIGSVAAAAGEVVRIPPAARGTVVFARLHGAGVDGLERLRSLVYRARLRYVLVNGGRKYRLVPGTAGDGLLMSSGPGIDYPGVYAIVPQARTISVTGFSGGLRVDLYAMPVRTR
ncbi:MAG: hypothetical protein QOH43_3647 [Solirubrobacteraceae bacterium]|nr:hypothetical protein [Solirubrobacteraceae bacterium]